MGSFYRSKHELIFVWKHGTAPHTNTFKLGQHGRYRTNVWDYAGVNTLKRERMEELAMHPTVKPVALVADAILDVSKRSDIILDPFAALGRPSSRPRIPAVVRARLSLSPNTSMWRCGSGSATRANPRCSLRRAKSLRRSPRNGALPTIISSRLRRWRDGQGQVRRRPALQSPARGKSVQAGPVRKSARQAPGGLPRNPGPRR